MAKRLLYIYMQPFHLPSHSILLLFSLSSEWIITSCLEVYDSLIIPCPRRPNICLREFCMPFCIENMCQTHVMKSLTIINRYFVSFRITHDTFFYSSLWKRFVPQLTESYFQWKMASQWIVHHLVCLVNLNFTVIITLTIIIYLWRFYT